MATRRKRVALKSANRKSKRGRKRESKNPEMEHVRIVYVKPPRTTKTGASMTYQGNDPRMGRDRGWSAGAIAAMVLAIIVVLGGLFYAMSGKNSTTAPNNRPAATTPSTTAQTSPSTTGQTSPSTTGQGGGAGTGGGAAQP